MSGKIIKPEGLELVNYLNDGCAICNICGALMDHIEDEKGICDTYVCPSCGWSIDTMDYEYEDHEEKEWVPEILDMYQGNVPPVGCRACGGPYPSCKTSCKLFDD